MVEQITSTSSVLQSRLAQIRQITQDLTRTLQAQRDLLQTRGDIMISSEGLNGLQQVHDELAELGKRLLGDATEIQQLRALARTTELINSALDLNLILDDVIDTVVAMTGAERGYIILRDTETNRLEIHVARNAEQQNLRPEEILLSYSVIEQVARDGQLIVTNDAANDKGLSNSTSIVGLRLRSILCAPLMRKGHLTGVIYADNRIRTDLFGEREKRLVLAFANQAAVAIENALLFEEVRASLVEITHMKDLMANVFASIPSGVITTDADDLITTFNAAATRILDIPEEDALHQPVWAVLPAPDESLIKALARVREQKSDQVIEVDTSFRNRSNINLGLTLSLLKGDEQAQGVAIVLNDLTAAKRHVSQINALSLYLPPELVKNVHLFDRARLEGEEREISVLSCDIRGFTSFSEGLQPEELMQIINGYLTISSAAIYEEGGIIDKFMGDAAIGLYNTQLMEAQPNHAEKAVCSAFKMARYVEEHHAQLPPNQRVKYGIGVHTGMAVLGNVGSANRKEFTAIGDTIQLAKLLQENALGGEVLISQETYERVKHMVEVEMLTPRKFKDRSDFTHMYRVTAINA